MLRAQRGPAEEGALSYAAAAWNTQECGESRVRPGRQSANWTGSALEYRAKPTTQVALKPRLPVHEEVVAS